MHELSITRNIVEIVASEAGQRRVERVRLAIGQLTAVMPDAVRFCFDVVSRGTVVDGASLEIDEVAGEAQCLHCGSRFPMPPAGARCGCGGRQHRLLAGEELKIVDMELGPG